MNYIGIRGHRGAGKGVFSYLLGKVLNYTIEGRDESRLYDSFKEWYDDIIRCGGDWEELDYDMNYVYLESFGDIPKTLVELLVGCKHEYIYNDYYKDHVIINLKDFTCMLYENIDSTIIETVSPEQMFLMMNKDIGTIKTDLYMTMRNFIIYFGREVMQRFFGVNIWIKSLIMSNNKFLPIDDDKSYKIYTDIKSNSELSFIKNNGGLIIKIERPQNKKPTKGIDNTDDIYDYYIKINDDVYQIFEDINRVVKNILNK